MKHGELLRFTIYAPKIGKGKYKNQLATVNNIPVWFRYYKTKIKKDFIETLGDWHVPKSDLMLEEADIEFTLLRNSKRKLDADALTVVYKWTIDYIVKQGWLKDDDKLRIIMNPTQIHESPETMFSVSLQIRGTKYTDGNIHDIESMNI